MNKPRAKRKKTNNQVDLQAIIDHEKIKTRKIEKPLYREEQHFTPTASSAPMVSSLQAQLRKDLWQKNESQLGYFKYQAKHNDHNIIEHFITNKGDIKILPWEEALQIIDKLGLNTAKLHLIFAAHTMRQENPWESKFTLKGTDLIAELGWDRRTDLSNVEKINEIAKAGFALGCLVIQAVWMEGKGRKKVECSVQTSRMWETLIDVRGQRLTSEGICESPEEVYLTVRPGLWTYAFLNKAGCEAKTALYQFGYLAQDILKIDPYHDEFALRLGLHLTIESRFYRSGSYLVKTLLEALLPKTEIAQALNSSDKAFKLTNRWNHALEVLMGLKHSFKIEFDPQTYPEALRPGSQTRKPRGYFKILLEAKITIHPPDPIPQLLANHKNLALPQGKRTRRQSTKKEPSPLNGLQIKNARQAKEWTQEHLAELLGVSQRYVSMFERDQRIPPKKLEAKLRKILEIGV